jgi:hypothetical protein
MITRVPPRYLPWITRPSFSSSVSAEAPAQKINAKAPTLTKCLNVFIKVFPPKPGGHTGSSYTSPK